MKVWASVNEADIGRVRPGQKVAFKVDAFPERVFEGEVGQIRLKASMTNNVVTYTVVVNTDNSDLQLRILFQDTHRLATERFGLIAHFAQHLFLRLGEGDEPGELGLQFGDGRIDGLQLVSGEIQRDEILRHW